MLRTGKTIKPAAPQRPVTYQGWVGHWVYVACNSPEEFFKVYPHATLVTRAY